MPSMIPARGDALALCAFTASLDRADGRTDIGFDGQGSEEGKIGGGYGEITFAPGDATTVKARRWIAERDGRS